MITAKNTRIQLGKKMPKSGATVKFDDNRKSSALA